MKQTIKSIIALSLGTILCVLFLASCAKFNYLEKTKTAEEIKGVENRLEKVYNMYLGHFSNAAQSRVEESAIYSAQELISVPMWTKRTGENWAYVCLMQEDKPEDLLSQEVWQFKRKDPETIEVLIYEVPNKDNYKGDWKKKEPLANLKPADLIYHGTCNTFIKRAETAGNFTIKSDACKRDFSDVIKYIEIEGELSPYSITLYNHMLDVTKKEIYSYEKGIKFIRLNKDEPKYIK